MTEKVDTIKMHKQAISLMEELDRCVKEKSQLKEKYKSCMGFLQLFILNASK